MRNSTLITLIFCIFTSYAFSQTNDFGVKAGPVYSQINDADLDFAETIGYYAGMYTTKPVTGRLEAYAEVNFLNQMLRFEDIASSVKSTNGLFAFNLYATDKLYFTGGFEIGFVVSAKVDGEKIEGYDKGRLGGVGGIGYKVNEKFAIDLRYISTISEQLFDRNFQLGIKYKL